MGAAETTVVHRTIVDFQRQYGTLWHAVEEYLDGQMLGPQAASFELIVDPGFLSAVAQTRLLRLLVG